MLVFENMFCNFIYEEYNIFNNKIKSIQQKATWIFCVMSPSFIASRLRDVSHGLLLHAMVLNNLNYKIHTHKLLMTFVDEFQTRTKTVR